MDDLFLINSFMLKSDKSYRDGCLDTLLAEMIDKAARGDWRYIL